MPTTTHFNLGTCLAAALALCAQAAMAAELRAVDFLKTDGTVLKREGGSHSLWMIQANGAVEAVPRTEIPNNLVRKICRVLGIPGID